MSTFTHQPLAIIGMACRLPGGDDLSAYWDLLRSGRSAIRELPHERFDPELYYHPERGRRSKSYTKIGALVSERQAAYETFRLTPDEVRRADVPHLEICSLVADACRQGQFEPPGLAACNTGVYIGHTRGSGLGGDLTYRALIGQTAPWLSEIDGFANLAQGDAKGVITDIVERTRRALPEPGANIEAYQAGRIVARAFGTSGPFLSLNAACASSLMALSLAANALDLGQIEMAVVGSASYCKFDSLVLFSRAQSVSETGSRPFDADADGLVTAEGYVILLVKTLDRALADKDRIQAIISGIGVSSDGRGKSLWAPREEGQVEAFRRAYASQSDIIRLQYIEAHATSTQVGDATEINALGRCLRESLPPGAKIPIGSTKANIGHALESAGMAGLVKTVLAMQHHCIPPVINLKRLNPRIDWEASPFFVPTEPLEWHAPADGSPRRAGVNAFGIGGCNTHVVLDEYVPTTQVSVPVAKIPEPGATGDDIAIIGIAAIVPGAHTTDTFWQLLCDGRSIIGEPPAERHRLVPGYVYFQHKTLRAGYLTDYEYDWRKHKVPPKQIAAADPLQFMLLDAVDQALEDAKLKDRPFDRKQATVIVGTMFGGEFGSQLHMGLRLPEFAARMKEVLLERGADATKIDEIYERFVQLFLQRMPAVDDETGSFTSSTLASRITKSFDLMGGAMAIDSGESSSLMAVAAGVDMLRTGRSNMVLCCSGQRSLGLNSLERLAASGRLNESFCPLDDQSSCTMLGEGAAVVILKRLADTQRDGDPIRGIVRGVGVAHHGDTEQAFEEAMRKALGRAGLDAGDVSAIEVASQGSRQNEQAELAAIARVYGGVRSQPLCLSSVAGQIGVIGGASGVLSLIKAVLELDRQQVVPTSKITHPAVPPTSQDLQVITSQTELTSVRADGRLFMGVNSLTRDDLAVHVILERPLPVVAPRSESTTPVPRSLPTRCDERAAFVTVRVSADSSAALIQDVQRLAESSTEAFASADAPAVRAQAPYRVLFVTRDAEELAEQARRFLAADGSARSRTALLARNIFVGGPTGPGKVAFLFPGQGSQYRGMGLDWAAQSADARDTLARLDHVLTAQKFPTLADMVERQAETLGQDVFQTQLSLLATGALLLQAVTATGLVPDRIAGHSFGEFTALYGAGAWDFATASRATFYRCRAITQCADVVGLMACCAADESTIASLALEIPGVHVANINSPRQTVVGGEPAAIQALVERLKQRNIASKIIAVPRPFHTPLMEPVKSLLAGDLASLVLEPPRVPLLSSVTNRYVAEGADIVANLVCQMTQPVPFTDLVQRFYREGVRTFVEIGPEQVLTKLVHAILPELDGIGVAVDEPRRSIAERGARLAALAELCEYRPAQPPMAARVPSVGVRAYVQQHVNGQTTCPANGAGIGHANGASKGQAKQQDPPPGTKGSTVAVQAVAPRRVPNGLLTLSGQPFDMGVQQGRQQRDAIRRVLRAYCDLPENSVRFLADLEPALSQMADLVPRDMLMEMEGIATGAGVPLEAIIAHHLRAYPDIEMGCCQMVAWAPPPNGTLLHGANEDLPLSLVLHEQLVRNIQVRHPHGGLALVTFGVAGQAGGINGINSAGVAVTSAMLLDLPRREATQRGVLHGFVVRQILERASNVEEALAVVREVTATGAWGMCVSHAASGQAALIEYDGEQVKTRPIESTHASANHSQLHQPVAAVPPHSLRRNNRLDQLLSQASSHGASPEAMQGWLRDRLDSGTGREARFPTMNTVRRVDNQISVLFAPLEARLWVTGCDQLDPDAYEALDLQELIGLQAVQAAVACSQTSAVMSEVTSVATSAQPAAASQALPLPTTQPSAQLPAITNWALEPIQTERPLTITPAEFRRLSTSVDGHSPLDASEKICNRFILRLIPSPLPPVDRGVLAERGVYLIVGNNAVARAIAAELASAGGQAVALDTKGTAEQVQANFDQIWQSCQPTQLILANSWESLAWTGIEEPFWGKLRERVDQVFRVCQRWFQSAEAAGALDRSGVWGVTRLGGNFAIAAQDTMVESGATAGIVKALSVEHARRRQEKFQTRVMDFSDSDAAESIARHVVDELCMRSSDIEVTYWEHQRHSLRPVPAPIEQHSPVAFRGRGPWVITGGARGVTAEMVRWIGREFGVPLHLIGSSPLMPVSPEWREMTSEQELALRAQIMRDALARGEVPVVHWERTQKAIEIDKNLRSFAEAGLDVTYHSCDVADRTALAKVLDAVRQQHGPIQGVVHGAGFEKSGRFSKKKFETYQRTMQAKVDGAAALMALTASDPLEAFIGFGSISGRFGGTGQVDYCMANDMLSKMAAWYRCQRPQVRTAVLAWHSWDEVGMAVRPEIRHVKSLSGMRFMPVAEGAGHLLNEIRSGCPDIESIITDWHYYKRFHPDQDRHGIAADPDSSTETETVASPAAHPQHSEENGNTKAEHLPLIDRFVEETPGVRGFAECRLDPVRDPFLVQHRFRDRPLLPFVIEVELMAETALRLSSPRQVAGLENVEILNGLRFFDDQPQLARIQAVKDGAGVAVEVVCDFRNRAGKLVQADRPYARARVRLDDSVPLLQAPYPGDPPEWFDVTYPREREEVLYHGPVFNRLRATCFDASGGWAKISAPALAELAGPRAPKDWLHSPATLDACLFACGIYPWFYQDKVVAIPHSLKHLSFGRIAQGGETCVLRFDYLGRNKGFCDFNFTLYGEDRSVVLQAEGFRASIIPGYPG